jgi:hypothetical protein
MNLAVGKNHLTWITGAAGALVIALAGLSFLTLGVTCNQALAVILSMIVITLWMYDRVNGIIAGIVFYMVKAFFLRLAFAIDFNSSGSGGFDLLGITPALLLSALIAWQIYSDIASGKPVLIGRTRILLAILCGLSFLSVFNPSNTLIVGLGGLVRNVIPNMMILFAVASLFSSEEHTGRFVKTMMVVGLISCVYAVGQFWLGLYPWETVWFNEVAFKDGVAGWLTIGLRGLEFRLFSVFYGYMDFFFSNVLIFAMALAMRQDQSVPWNRMRKACMAAWIVVLLLSLERMPMLMTAVVVLTVAYLRGNARRKKLLVWGTVGIIAFGVIGLNVAAPVLRGTGATKFARLAEMANPLHASSIADRVERKWKPTLATIASNPMGVGIGYGSSSRANTIAAETGLHVEPHNELLQKTLELGVPGGMVYLLLLISVYRDARKAGSAHGSRRVIGFTVIGGSLAFWICGMVNVPFSGANGLLFWALTGAVVAINQKASASRHNEELERF